MKPHLPESLLLLVAVASLSSTLSAYTYTNAEFTATSTGTGTANAVLNSSDPVNIAPNVTGSINLSNGYNGTLTIHGSSTGASIATSSTNGGIGGRVFFSGVPASNLQTITLDKGIEASMGAVFENASGLTFSFDNASFYINAGSTLASNLHIGEGGVRLNGSSSATYTFSGALTGSGTIYSVTAKSNHKQIFTGDVSAFTGTYTETASRGAEAKTWQFGNGGACAGGAVGGQIGRENVLTRAAFNYTGDYAVNGKVYASELTIEQGNATFKSAVQATAATVTTAGLVTFEQNAAITTLTISGNAEGAASFSFTSGSLGTVSGRAASMVKTGVGALMVGDLGAGNTLTVNAGSITGTLTNGAIAAGTGGSLGTASTGFTLNGGTLDFGNLTGTGSTLSYTGSLTLTSGNLAVSGIDSSILTGGTYTLLSGTGASGALTGFTINGVTVAQDGTFTMSVNDQWYTGVLGWSQGGDLQLQQLALLPSKTLTWGGGATGTWSANGTGWNEGSATGGTSSFNNGDTVNFLGDTVVALTVEGTVAPAEINVSGSADVILSAGTNGSVQGTGSVSVGDTATLTVNTSNTYSGGTTISGGILHANAANALGTGDITLAGGMLNANADNALGTANVNLNGGSLVLAHNGTPGTGSMTFNGGVLQYGVGVSVDVSSRLRAGTGAVKVDIGANDVAWATTPAGELSISGTNGSLTLNDTTSNGPSRLTIDGGNVILTDGSSLKTDGNFRIQTVITLTGGSLLISGAGGSSNGSLYGGGSSKWSYLLANTLQLRPDAGKTVTVGEFGTTDRGISFANATALSYDGSSNGGTATINANIIAMGTSGTTSRTFDIADSAGTDVEVDIQGNIASGGIDGQGTTIVKTGNGTLQITGSNDIPGLTIAHGTVIANNAQALGKDRVLKNTVTVGSVAGQTATLDLRVSNAAGVTQLLGNADGVITNNGQADTVLKIGHTEAASRLDSSFDGTITGAKLGVELIAGNKLALSGTNTYQGSTVVGREAELSLKGSGSIDNGKAKIAARTSGTDAVLSNATVSSSGISRTTGTTETDRATISNAHVTVSLDTAAAAYDIANVVLVDSLVTLQTAGNVTLSNVSIGAGTTLANTGNATLSLANSGLILNSGNIASQPAAPGTGSPVALSYGMANASVSGTFTLDLTAELLNRIGNINGSPFTDLQITLTDVTAWNDVTLSTGPELGALGATATTSGLTGGSVVINIHTTMPIPEPSTATLGLLALSALLCRRRRRA